MTEQNRSYIAIDLKSFYASVECKERGLATKTFDGRWHLTPNGFLISNHIISDLLVIQEKN